MEQLTVEAQEGLGVLKSPRLPLVVIGALEAKVCDVEETMGVRLVCWSRLLRTYGVLRTDDLQRVSPCDVSLQDSGLSMTLRRTKTTRGGKKVRDLVDLLLMLE